MVGSVLRTQRVDRVVGAVLLATALACGGGSALFPTARLIVELVGAGALAWQAARGWRAPVTGWSAAAVVLLVLVLALPLIQLVPLPPAVWTALPGRSDAAGILAAEGMAGRWMPISLEPDNTRLAAAYLVPVVAVFLATLHAGWRDRMLFGWIVVAAALAGALLGLTQVGGGGVYPYETAHRGSAVGLFANKNHEADMLLIGLILAAALARMSSALGIRGPGPLATTGLVIVLALSVPATFSRAGLALLPVALLPAVLMLIPTGAIRRARWRSGAAGLLVLLVAIAVAAGSGTVARLLGRFGGDPDLRLTFWPDVVTALHRYQPVGAGLGSFVAIFQRDESLASLGLTYVNHAHNDVLEIVLEAGLAGAVLIGFAVVLAAVGGWRALRPDGRSEAMPVQAAAVVALVILAAHSMLDYPLRTLALSCTMAFLAGCLAPGAVVEGPADVSPAGEGPSQGLR